MSESTPIHPTSDALPTPLESAAPNADASKAQQVQDSPTEDAPASKSAEPRDAKPPAVGTALNGKVVSTSDAGVVLDVGCGVQAIVPASQFDDGVVPEMGVEVPVVSARFDSSADVLHVHRRGVVIPADWKTLSKGILLEGQITGMIKGGLEVQCGPVRAFMPGSQVDPHHIKDISILLGQTTRCEVLEVDCKRKSVIVSRKRALRMELARERERLVADLQPGQVRKGVVVNLTDYGAFVDLGGVHGLVHIRDLSWKPIGKPADVVQIGDEVVVKILKIDRARERISLGLKQAAPNPWNGVEKKFTAGTKISARIVRLADFGAFAEVTDGVDGLIPLSEMLWSHRPHKASEVVQIGQTLDVIVVDVSAKRRRMALSIKRLTEDPWTDVRDAFPADSIVKGKVKKTLEFGALVELRAGVEGLVHISEMAHHHIRNREEIAKVGDEVEVKVLHLDLKRRRISLSIKAASGEDRAPDTPANADAKSKAKRKKPRRGGLASHFEW